MIKGLVISIITIGAAGFLTTIALWFVGYMKICQAWAWLFKDWDRRF